MMKGESFQVDARRELNTLDTQEWDKALGRHSFFSSSRWLRHAHATAAEAPMYFTARRDGALAAVLPAYPLQGDSPYIFCRPDFVLSAIHERRFGVPATWTQQLMPALVCGGRNPGHSSIAVCDAGERSSRSVISALLREVETHALRERLHSISFLYVDEDDVLLRETLSASGYAALASEPTYSIPLCFGATFPDYLEQFKRRQRIAIKREIRALGEAGVIYRSEPLTQELIPKLVPLEMALYAKHGTACDSTSLTGVMSSIAAHVGEAAQVVTAWLREELVGFVIVFEHRNEWYARQAGFDYGLQGRLPLYFGLAYYELIRLAKEKDISEIHYSIGSGGAKLSRGCIPHRQFAYIKLLDSTLDEELRTLMSSIDLEVPYSRELTISLG